jgi:hypothetical protein
MGRSGISKPPAALVRARIARSLAKDRQRPRTRAQAKREAVASRPATSILEPVEIRIIPEYNGFNLTAVGGGIGKSGTHHETQGAVRAAAITQLDARLVRGILLRPGRFYRARNGTVWCCFKIDLERSEDAQATCVLAGPHRPVVEFFFLDGRFDAAGEHDHALIEEVRL